jgi:hypothetical protein
MKKLDRLGWAAGISLLAYGVRVGVRVSEPELLARVTGCLAPAWRLAQACAVERLYSLVSSTRQSLRPGLRRFNLLYANTRRVARAVEIDDVLAALESDLRLYVAQASRQRLFVQAGVVGFNDQAIVIPGHSRTGKSTLVAELVRAGATYYSDQYALIDARGRVHPYPAPLGIRVSTGEKPERRTVEEPGRVAASKPLPVVLVVLSRFKAGARWRPRQLSSGLAVLEMLAHTVSARRHPETALARLNRAIASARVLKGVRGEAKETIDFILSRI